MLSGEAHDDDDGGECVLSPTRSIPSRPIRAHPAPNPRMPQTQSTVPGYLRSIRWLHTAGRGRGKGASKKDLPLAGLALAISEEEKNDGTTEFQGRLARAGLAHVIDARGFMCRGEKEKSNFDRFGSIDSIDCFLRSVQALKFDRLKALIHRLRTS